MDQNKKTKKLNILYRVIPLVCSLVIILASMCPVKVNAADYYFDIFVVDSGVSLGNNYFVLNFPTSYCRLSIQSGGETIQQANGSYSISVTGDNLGWYVTSNQLLSARATITTRVFGSNYIRTESIPNGSNLTVFWNSGFVFSPWFDSATTSTHAFGCGLTGRTTIRYYDAQHNEIGRQYSNPGFQISENNSTLLGRNNFKIDENHTFALQYPEGAVTFQVWQYLDVTFSARTSLPQFIGFTYTLDTNNLNLIVTDSGATDEVIDQIIDLNNKNQIIIDQNQQMLQNQNSLINGTPGQNQQVQGSLNDFQQSDQKLNDLTDDLQVNKPTLDTNDVAVENIVDTEMTPIYTAPFLKLWESPIIVTVLAVVLTLVMISFVFFGKKG